MIISLWILIKHWVDLNTKYLAWSSWPWRNFQSKNYVTLLERVESIFKSSDFQLLKISRKLLIELQIFYNIGRPRLLRFNTVKARLKSLIAFWGNQLSYLFTGSKWSTIGTLELRPNREILQVIIQMLWIWWNGYFGQNYFCENKK